MSVLSVSLRPLKLRNFKFYFAAGIFVRSIQYDNYVVCSRMISVPSKAGNFKLSERYRITSITYDITVPLLRGKLS